MMHVDYRNYLFGLLWQRNIGGNKNMILFWSYCDLQLYETVTFFVCICVVLIDIRKGTLAHCLSDVAHKV